MLFKSSKRENFDNILANELDFNIHFSSFVEIFLIVVFFLSFSSADMHVKNMDFDTHFYLCSFDAIYSGYRTDTRLLKGKGDDSGRWENKKK